MKQFVMKLKNGKAEIVEVPTPLLQQGMILVRNRYSVISAGTESETLQTARKSLLGKALDRPKEVKKVFEVLEREGIWQTYQHLRNRLDSYSDLGYSCSGVVLQVGHGVEGIEPGDQVACAGVGYANHAEIVVVPKNLCVRLSESADLKQAAYNTLGAIALQGVRQADLKLGETCVVIGLGLVGQLTVLLLRAAGIHVVGVDVDPEKLKTAGQLGLTQVYLSNDPALEAAVLQQTRGVGADGIIITAATESVAPVNAAGRFARQRGRVIIVGNVPTGFDREPYYRKELELRMSCSYGPGRYDVEYEQHGRDYPAGYVRWTENRNMQAFQDLLAAGKINLEKLTTHVFDFSKAPEAYDLILRRHEPCVGVLLRYPEDAQDEKRKVELTAPTKTATIQVGFIGAGNYASAYLLPHLARQKDCRLEGVLSARGAKSRSVAEKFGFHFCTSEEREILQHPTINTLFIATPHQSHAAYVLKGLKSGKHIFVEKPLCINPQELAEIETTVQALAEKGESCHLMVGFNRRFSPLSTFIKQRLEGGPVAMSCRVSARALNPASWAADAAMSGGRIVGEVCHFIDWMLFICGSVPSSVYATQLTPGTGEDVQISLKFKDGSTGQITYFTQGPVSLFKEALEVYSPERAFRIEDFKVLHCFESSKITRKKLGVQNKGQAIMVDAFIQSLKTGVPLIPFAQLRAVTQASFAVLESLKTNQPVFQTSSFREPTA